MNNDLRRKIVDMVIAGKNGHIPSAFSIVDIVDYLYYEMNGNDLFLLSKGHGCLALYAVLHKYGILSDEDIAGFCKPGGKLGEHPDRNKHPAFAASTGSLGHGFPFSVGLALGNRIQHKSQRIFVLVGDGECHEGAIWEAANVARNLELGQLCVIVDWNKSGMQHLPYDGMSAKWRAFGWNFIEIDGHDNAEIAHGISKAIFCDRGIPLAVIAHTVKGKGVPMLEGHGPWHSKIPNAEEYAQIMEALK